MHTRSDKHQPIIVLDAKPWPLIHKYHLKHTRKTKTLDKMRLLEKRKQENIKLKNK